MTAAQHFPCSVAVGGIPIVRRDGVWYTHHSFGRVVDLLAGRVREIHYHGTQAPEAKAGVHDYPLERDNIIVHAWPSRRNTLEAMKNPLAVLGEYWRLVGAGQSLFLRGSLPLVWAAHLMARVRGRPVTHWLVGNPVAILRGEQRGYGSLMQKLGVAFALFEQVMTRLAIRVSDARVLANGGEVARIYRSRHIREVVSTSITEADFRVQDDTCAGPEIRLLFVGFIRPEKGIEYLVRALPMIKSDRPVRLSLVGGWGQFSAEKERLAEIARQLGFEDRVSWEGYAAFGPDLFGHIDRADILVLPSLSEGTPRVLVEARARSVPIVSTNVGGIPSSVRDGVDGLLVPPRQPGPLAAAISRIVNDGALRRGLIAAGRERVRELTVERFVDLVVECLQAGGSRCRAAGSGASHAAVSGGTGHASADGESASGGSARSA